MLRSLYTAGTGMVAQQHNLDVISNNLANVNTTGFKQQRAEFQDLMYTVQQGSGAADSGRPEAIVYGTGVKVSATATNFSQGSLENTDNPLNVAIQNAGFFKLTGPDGNPVYTRDGNFQLNANGDLTSNDGYLVNPNIHIPTDASAVSIDRSGKVNYIQNGNTVEAGQITLTTVANPAGMSRIGGNLFIPTAASGDPQDHVPGTEGAGTLEAGFLEGSNVQVVTEMTRMITAQRAYEINSKAIQTADDMLSIVNNLKR